MLQNYNFLAQLTKYIRLFLWLIGLYLLGIGSIFFLQHRIIFQPVTLTSEHQFEFEQAFREMNFPTGDGAVINALFFPAPDSSKGLILYFHGNSDNLQRWGAYQNEFTRRGYDALAMDYRGYGKSSGKIGETTMYQDAAMLYQWALKSYTPERIVLYGRSLGTAVASNLASREKARILILETPYDNMQNLFLMRTPALLLPFRLDYSFPNDQHLPKVKYPVFIFHGTHDKVVPYHSGLRLKKQFKPGDVFITIDGGNHRNLSDYEKFHRELDKILN